MGHDAAFPLIVEAVTVYGLAAASVAARKVAALAPGRMAAGMGMSSAGASAVPASARTMRAVGGTRVARMTGFHGGASVSHMKPGITRWKLQPW